MLCSLVLPTILLSELLATFTGRIGADPQRREQEVAAAAATASLPPSSGEDSVFCAKLTQYLELAATEFAQARGAVQMRHPDTGQPVSWTPTIMLPGATTCTVFGSIKDFQGLIQCEMAAADDDTELDAPYAKQVQAVSACLPTTVWTKSERKSSLPAGRALHTTFHRRGAAVRSLGVSLVPPNPYRDKSAVVITVHFPDSGT